MKEIVLEYYGGGKVFFLPLFFWFLFFVRRVRVALPYGYVVKWQSWRGGKGGRECTQLANDTVIARFTPPTQKKRRAGNIIKWNGRGASSHLMEWAWC